MQLAWENSPHFATPPVVCPRNDVWENSAEIPYWWRALARSEISFWLVANLLHLIGSSTQISVHNGISALVSQTSFRGETTGSVVKCRLFSHATMQQVSWNCVKYYAIFYKGNTSFFFFAGHSPCFLLCLFCVRRLSRPSRSTHFGDVDVTNCGETNSLNPRDPKRILVGRVEWRGLLGNFLLLRLTTILFSYPSLARRNSFNQ